MEIAIKRFVFRSAKLLFAGDNLQELFVSRDLDSGLIDNRYFISNFQL